MKKVIKKNQVIITALAIMIAVAGYLNYSDFQFGLDKTKDADASQDAVLSDSSDADTDTALEDIQSLDYDITDEENQTTTQTTDDTDVPGEAVLTGASSYIAQVKLSREQVRSANKESLMEIIDNTELTEEERQDAVASMVTMSDLVERESAAETMLAAKGFEDVVVNLTGETADVVVPQQELSSEQLAQIEDVVNRKTGTAPENIVITPMTTEK